jgi:hypothetical protein
MKLIVCDNCRKLILNGLVPVGFGDERKDACSEECAKKLAQPEEEHAGSDRHS